MNPLLNGDLQGKAGELDQPYRQSLLLISGPFIGHYSHAVVSWKTERCHSRIDCIR